jgi:NADP-dependent 3-hydroxy acid dehydrogenase YdfG
MGRLNGKVAVITGAASRIGRATAIKFAGEGAAVVIADLNVEGGEAAVRDCKENAGRAAFQKTDVSAEAEINALIARAIKEFGRLHIIYNNAGIVGAVGSLEQTSVEDWDKSHAVLLRGVFLGMKHAAPELRKAGGGSIVSTASVAGIRGLAGSHTYCAAKAGVVNLTRSAALEFAKDKVRLADGKQRKFDALLLATGAEPVRLKIPGADLPHVCYLRSRSDCRSIIAKVSKAKHVVLMGASFIAMEVASSLIQRKLKVHVVAPEAVPMERVLGPQVGAYLHRLHERNGVVFHLQQSVVAIDERKVTLKDGHTVSADLVVIGIGVKPLIDLAERAGIKTDRGVSVNEHLETSIPGIFAAGDIARWPDPLTGDSIRVEHWVVAERQGQTAARNILGRRERFDAVPFFWTSQFDFTLNYIGHAEKWDKLDLEGSIEDHDCKLSFQRAGKTLAVATIGRDRESLENEVAMERFGRRV